MKTVRKYKLGVLMAGCLILPLVAFGSLALAQAQETDQDPAANPARALQARINQRKSDRQLQLSASEQARLRFRCAPAQGLLKAAAVRIAGVETSRTRLYAGLVGRLDRLAGNLQDQAVNTAVLTNHIGELKSKTETFSTMIADYKQTLSDLGEMDCADDTEGFKASLEQARELLAGLRRQTTDIHTYLMETVKPALEDLRRQAAGGGS